MERESFVLYTEQKEIFKSLSDEQAGKLIKEIFDYMETGQEPNLDGILKIAFIPIRQSLDRNNDKWEDIKQKRSLAGKKSAELKKQQKATNLTSVDFVKNKTTNSTVNDNVNVNVNDNVNDKEEVKEEPDSCVDEVIEFYNNNITTIGQYSASVLQEYVQELGKDLVIYAMKISVENNARNIKYIKAILNNWAVKGVKSIAEAKEQESKFKKKTEIQKIESDTDWESMYDN